MSACRLCGREVTGTVCPACGTPVGESVPWAPLGPPSATAVQPPHVSLAPGTQSDSYAVTGAPYASPNEPSQAGPAPAVGAYGQPYSPYAPAGPAQPADAPYDPYAAGYGGPPPYAGPTGQQAPGGYLAQGYPVPGGQQYGAIPPGGAGYAAGPRPRRPWWAWVAPLLAVALVVVAVLVGQRLLGGAGVPAPTATTPAVRTTAAQPTTPATSAAAPTTPATGAPATEDQALAALRQAAATDLPRLNAAVTGRSWVAQLSSKSVGISDPLQTAANGTHVFFALDILAEHNQLKAKVVDATVILADSTTYGSRATDTGSRPYWRTLALSPAFTSEAAVAAWCQRTFAPMTGAELENQCVGTQL